MTKEEAVNVLCNTDYLYSGRCDGKIVFSEALNMAISALKAQSDNDDIISRQDAIDTVEESRRLNRHQDGKEACAHEYEHRHFLKILRDLPSAQSQPEPTCNNLATDTISRQAAIDALCGECQGRCIPCEAYPCSEVRALENVPSAQPEPQWIPCSKRLPKKIEKDYWICTDEGWQCVCRWRKFPSMRGDFWAWNVMHPVVAWMPRPEPYREGD